LRYWNGEKEVKLTLGEYSFVSLGDARERRNDLMKSKAHGIDPKTQLKSAEVVCATFEKVAHVRGLQL